MTINTNTEFTSMITARRMHTPATFIRYEIKANL